MPAAPARQILKMLSLFVSASALQQPLSRRAAVLSGAAAAATSIPAVHAFDLPMLDAFDGVQPWPLWKNPSPCASESLSLTRVPPLLLACLDPKARKEAAKRVNPPVKMQQGKAFYAVSTGAQADLESMISAGWDLPACRDDAGKTVLHQAAKVGNGPAVTSLIKAGAPIDATTTWKETPLHMAARNNKLTTVKQLVDAGASTTKQTYGGDTALAIATKYKFKEVADYLATK